jgi:hypothetical protein
MKPTIEQLRRLPCVKPGRYQLSDQEIAALRRRIYSQHKDNAAGWRWATRKIGDVLVVWRIS